MSNASSESPAFAWLGEDSAGWLVSLAVHAALIVVLAAATLALPSTAFDLELAVEPLDLADPDQLAQEFFSSDDSFEDIGALSHGGDASALASANQFSDETLVELETEPLSDFVESPVDLAIEIMQGPESIENLAVQGIGSVGTTGASGAIDRLTHEILASLENRPTLVVWLFDQSGSLQAERDAILERFDRIYEELGVVEASQNPAFRKHEDKPLLTAVVGFGETPRMLTERPTDQLADIKAAVARIEDDQTGRENVFQAVGLAAEKFRTYRLARQNRRHVMMIVFTDEAGDDVDALDDAVRICRKHAMSVYVVGRPAPMGRETAYVKWVDPDPNFDQRPQWVPVRLGPESLVPERLKLGFVGGGAQGALLDSGFGPYALTRLCYETGGIYFAVHPNRVVGRSVSGRETSNLAVHLTEFFDPEVMRRYQPDYVSVAEYQRMLRGNRAKAALVAAAQASWTSPMENVRLRFPKRDEARLAESLSIAQRSAAFLQPQIDQICQTLLAGENDRSRLSEPRWQAGYDLATGRALAVQVRTAAYNAALAEAKQGMEFKSPESNTWILKSDDEYANSALSKTAAKATDYLMRVTEDHCETPWALLAQRELTQPFGWRWSEGFTPLPPEGSSRGRGQNRPRRENRPAKRPPRRDPPPL